MDPKRSVPATPSHRPDPGALMAAVAAAATVTVATLLLVLRPLSVVLPAAGLDNSWMAVLGRAAALPARWGVDLAFTYGPAADLITRFSTDAYLPFALPVLCGVALVQGAAVAFLVGEAVAGRRFAALSAALAVAAEVAGLATGLWQDQDGFVFALVVTLFVVDLVRRPGQRGSAVLLVAGAAVLGALAMSKTSFAVAALLVFAVADARSALVRRRVPVLVPVFLAAALLVFLVHGQRLSDLPAYVALQGQVAAGYGEAMYLAPRRLEVASFLSAAAALVGVAALAAPPRRLGRSSTALATGIVLLIAFKAGFIRADSHPTIAWSALGLSGLAVGFGLVLPRSKAGAAALAALSLVALWVLTPLFLRINPNQIAAHELPASYGDMAAAFDAETGAWARFLRSPSGFAARIRADEAEAWAALRNGHPVPALPGTVDMIPSEQSVLLANGLDYRPRPSFQEYSTYTAGLIAANRAFYAGPDAPDWVIFGTGALDDRYPTSIEGALWPELLRRYEPQKRMGDWVALKRRATPLPDLLGPPVRREAELGERVAVPAEGPVFARIAVRETPLGRLAAAVFRPPALSLRVTVPGSADQVFRFIPAIAADGFLLSPLVDDAAGFAALAFGQGDGAGAPLVGSVTVEGPSWAHFFYDPVVSFDFRPLTVPAVTPSPAAHDLAADLARDLPWRRLARAIDPGGHMDGSRLFAMAPATLRVPVSGAHRLHIAFGIADGAWTGDAATRGVCFAVTAPADGAAPGSDAAPLWRRCLDPKTVPADRGPQSADVDLPPGTSAVLAETRCRESCDWGWSYWSDIAPDGPSAASP